MKPRISVAARDYLRVVEWSPEDRCFVGSAPPLIGRCCHGQTEAGVLKQLKRIVEEWIRLADKDGVGLPAAERSDAYSGRFVARAGAGAPGSGDQGTGCGRT